MNISGIFTVKKAKRSSEFLNPENLKSMTVTMNYKRNIYISGNSEINGNVNERNSYKRDIYFFYEYMIIIFNNNGQKFNCNVMHNSRILCEISKLL